MCNAFRSAYESIGSEADVEFINARSLSAEELQAVASRCDLNDGIEVQGKDVSLSGHEAVLTLMSKSKSRVIKGASELRVLARVCYWVLVRLRRLILRLLKKAPL